MDQLQIKASKLDKQVASAFRDRSIVIEPKLMCHHCKILFPFQDVLVCMNKVANRDLVVGKIGPKLF